MPSIYRAMRPLLEKMGVYKIYEKMLEKHVRQGGMMPRHVGIILDGNRRWARQYGLTYEKAYRIGAKKVEDVIRWCRELGIKHLTIFVLSTENYENRSYEELSTIMNLLREYLEKLLKHPPEEGVRIKFIGDISRLDKDLISLINSVENRFSNSDGLSLNVALVYGGKWDIVNAARRLAYEVREGRIRPEDITQEVFQNYLSTSYLKDSQDLDLVLRTGGEMRISNFLLWQMAYSELVFIDVSWPEFRKIDFLRAIRTYQTRSRRFGA